MKSILIILAVLIQACGAVEDLSNSVDKASKTKTETTTDAATNTPATASNGSVTVTASVTATVSTGTAQGSTTTPVSGTSSTSTVADALSGTWNSSCDHGIMYQKIFKDGLEVSNYLMYSDMNCEVNEQVVSSFAVHYTIKDGTTISTSIKEGSLIPQQLFKSTDNGGMQFCDTTCNNASISVKTYDPTIYHKAK